MSLSTCEKCGGHIPLGPDATNRCESCGLGVFDAHTDPFPMGHLGEYVLETRNERNRYKDALERIANEEIRIESEDYEQAALNHWNLARYFRQQAIDALSA